MHVPPGERLPRRCPRPLNYDGIATMMAKLCHYDVILAALVMVVAFQRSARDAFLPFSGVPHETLFVLLQRSARDEKSVSCGTLEKGKKSVSCGTLEKDKKASRAERWKRT